MRILGFGTYDSSRHPRIGVILEGLRAHGDTVVEANFPLGLTTAERVRMLERPWQAYRLAVRLLSRWIQMIAATVRARQGGPIDAVIVGYMGHFDVLLARLLFPRTTVAVDLLIFAADTAEDRGVSARMRLKTLRLLDAAACRSADIVLVDTEEHARRVPQADARKVEVVPVGASEHWFSAVAADRLDADGPLRVVFFGLFTPLQGAPVVGEAIAMLADDQDIAFTMIGTGQDYRLARILAAPSGRVTWIDWVDPDELPSVVSAHDVCLGVFGTSAKAQRVIPNKVYQGAAAGCAIVTSDTAPQRRALGDAAVFVRGGDPADLEEALRGLASDREMTASHRKASRQLSSSRFTPAVVVKGLRTALIARLDSSSHT
jgi:glycosyltransferase involved in cell wall biosynthesis